jgi:hypothetical protein
MFASCSLSATINKFSPLIDGAGNLKSERLQKSSTLVHQDVSSGAKIMSCFGTATRAVAPAQTASGGTDIARHTDDRYEYG